MIRYAIMYSLFILGITIGASIFSLYLNEFSNSVFLIGIIGSLFYLSSAMSSILVGDASDKYGTKRFILLGLFFTSIFYVAYYLNPWLWVIIVLQVLTGISREFVFTPFFALMRDGSGTKDLVNNFSLLQTLATVGYIIGPLIGGYIALSNIRLPFIFTATFLVAAYALMLKSKEPRFKRRDVKIGLNSYRESFNDFLKLGPEAKKLIMSLFSLHCWYTSKWFIGPLFLVYLGFNSSEVGMWLSMALVPYLLLSLPFGNFVGNHREEKRRMLIWAMMLVSIPMLFLGFSNGLWVYFFVVFISIGNVLIDMILESRFTEITPKNEYGEVTGIIQFTKNIGGITGPLLTTFFAQFLGFQFSFIPIFLMYVISMVFLMRK